MGGCGGKWRGAKTSVQGIDLQDGRAAAAGQLSPHLRDSRVVATPTTSLCASPAPPRETRALPHAVVVAVAAGALLGWLLLGRSLQAHTRGAGQGVVGMAALAGARGMLLLLGRSLHARLRWRCTQVGGAGQGVVGMLLQGGQPAPTTRRSPTTKMTPPGPPLSLPRR